MENGESRVNFPRKLAVLQGQLVAIIALDVAWSEELYIRLTGDQCLLTVRDYSDQPGKKKLKRGKVAALGFSCYSLALKL